MGPNQTGEPPKNWRQERHSILYTYSCKSGDKKDRTGSTLVTQFILNSNSCTTESISFFRRYFNKISQFWPDSTISVAWFHYLCNRPIIGKSTISFKLEREGNPAVNVKEILQSCVTGKQWCARPLKAVTNTTNPHDESTTYNQKCALFSNKKWHGQARLKKKIVLNKIMTQLREENYLTLILVDFPDQFWHEGK